LFTFVSLANLLFSAMARDPLHFSLYPHPLLSFSLPPRNFFCSGLLGPLVPSRQIIDFSRNSPPLSRTPFCFSLIWPLLLFLPVFPISGRFFSRLVPLRVFPPFCTGPRPLVVRFEGYNVQVSAIDLGEIPVLVSIVWLSQIDSSSFLLFECLLLPLNSPCPLTLTPAGPSFFLGLTFATLFFLFLPPITACFFHLSDPCPCTLTPFFLARYYACLSPIFPTSSAALVEASPRSFYPMCAFLKASDDRLAIAFYS